MGDYEVLTDDSDPEAKRIHGYGHNYRRFLIHIELERDALVSQFYSLGIVDIIMVHVPWTNAAILKDDYEKIQLIDAYFNDLSLYSEFMAYTDLMDLFQSFYVLQSSLLDFLNTVNTSLLLENHCSLGRSLRKPITSQEIREQVSALTKDFSVKMKDILLRSKAYKNTHPGKEDWNITVSSESGLSSTFGSFEDIFSFDESSMPRLSAEYFVKYFNEKLGIINLLSALDDSANKIFEIESGGREKDKAA